MKKIAFIFVLIVAVSQAFSAEILGRVYVDNKDISLLMLAAGYAWHYTQYDNSPEYSAIEKKARSAGVGLWADRSPVPPWIFRRQGK